LINLASLASSFLLTERFFGSDELFATYFLAAVATFLGAAGLLLFWTFLMAAGAVTFLT